MKICDLPSLYNFFYLDSFSCGKFQDHSRKIYLSIQVALFYPNRMFNRIDFTVISIQILKLKDHYKRENVVKEEEVKKLYWIESYYVVSGWKMNARAAVTGHKQLEGKQKWRRKKNIDDKCMKHQNEHVNLVH